MSDFLTTMAACSRERSVLAQTTCSLEQAKERCLDLPPTTKLTAPEQSMGVIAEIKVRSPAEGKLADGVTIDTVIERADRYLEGGASVLSVLTEPERFEGNLDYLAAVKAHVGRRAAVMRKDFLVDDYQLYEARLHGADGVLLIARILDDDSLRQMLDTARQLDLFVLLEAFDDIDLRRMAPFADDQILLGLNCRDLTTLKIDPSRFADYIDYFPSGSIKVAESGLHSVQDAARVHALGYDMALIGTMLMKTADPAGTIAELINTTAAS